MDGQDQGKAIEDPILILLYNYYTLSQTPSFPTGPPRARKKKRSSGNLRRVLNCSLIIGKSA